MSMFTPAFDAFVAPARRKPSVLNLLLGIGITVLIYFIGILLLLLGVWLTSGEDALREWMLRMANEIASTPTSVLLMLMTFIGMGLGPLCVARVIHDRSMGSLFGPRRIVVRDFILGVVALAVVVGGMVALFGLGTDLVPGVPFYLWLNFLPLALVAVLIQTGAEEVLFRGYIQTQLAARFRSPLMWMVLPSVIFGVLHYDPNGGVNTWLVVAATTLFGLLAADLTRVTGSIGAAWGFHFANNSMSILVVTLAGGPLSGMALYQTPFTAENADILPSLLYRDLATTLIIWLVLRILLARMVRS